LLPNNQRKACQIKTPGARPEKRRIGVGGTGKIVAIANCRPINRFSSRRNGSQRTF
jgi:hypothetical protein